MRWVLVALLAVHGLIHLMGFAKAFAYADLPQLTLPISHAWGSAWLAAAVLTVATAALVAAGSRGYWVVGAGAVLVSQIVIASAWRDAWAGTAVNVLLALVVVHGFLTEGPWSFHAQYLREAEAGMAHSGATPVVTTADLAPLPEPVRRYLQLAGVVGQPRVRNYRLRFRGRIRSAPDAAWMPFEAEQQSFVDRPTRLFLMRARMRGAPVEAFHRLIDGHATMQVTALGAVPIVAARGAEMDRSETVTLFNDMCLLAPGTLLDSAIVWEPIDARSTRARFTQRGTTISATLMFDADGRLANFESDDRSRSSPDGTTFTPLRFSTPVRDYRVFGPLTLPGHGDARWRLPEGEFTYGEFDLVEAVMNAR